jgi:spore coat polysaccharide biosynthesis protein SpsF (cytidylyltransferase family)
MIRVLVGIQARSTSERLPGKALANLYDKPILSWVLNSCLESVRFINERSGKIKVDLAILCPIGDQISSHYKHVQVIEGDEFDVLSRYIKAQKLHRSDYIVRITGDCPFIASFQITNHIFKAINHGLDYLSNVDPLCRTELEGRDIEVISNTALEWLDLYSKKHFDREHVTTKLREAKPDSLRRGHFLNRIDLSNIKTSIDTDDDLNNADKLIVNFHKKKFAAEQDVGKNFVFYN